MSGRLAFITTNRALTAYDADQQRQKREDDARQAREVDAATRSGLASLVAGSPPATTPAPAAAPSPAPAAATTPASTVGDPTDDDDAAVRTIIGEAAGQGEAGMAGVAHVVRNRARQSGMTPRQVVLAPSQFEPWQTRRAELMGIDRNSPQYQEALRVWRASGDGSLPDPTGGADHFLNPQVVRQRRGGSLPSWAQGEPTVIGAHNFYRVGYRGAPGAATPSPQASAPAAAAAPPPQPQPAQGAAGGMAGNPMMPAIQRLLRTPGGGAQALRLIQAGETMASRREASDLRRQRVAGQAGQADARQRQRDEQNMMVSLGRGDIEVARLFAQRAGINLPEQVWNDRQNHARFAAGAMLARRFYSDREQAAQFVREYVGTGDALGAAERVGAPRGQERGWRPVWVQEGERQVLTLLNPNTGQTRQPTGADGSAVTLTKPEPAGRAGAGRGGAATAERRASLMRIYNDAALVDRMMSGVAPNPRQIDSALRSHSSRIAMANPGWNPQRVRQAAEADMDRSFPDWRRILQGAAVPQPGTPPPETLRDAPTEGGDTPPPVAPASAPSPPAPTYRLRDGTEGRLTGDRTRDGRPVYVTPDGRRFAPNASASTAPRV